MALDPTGRVAFIDRAHAVRLGSNLTGQLVHDATRRAPGLQRHSGWDQDPRPAPPLRDRPRTGPTGPLDRAGPRLPHHRDRQSRSRQQLRRPGGLAADSKGRPAVAYAVQRRSGKTFLRLATFDGRGKLHRRAITQKGFPQSAATRRCPGLVNGRLHVVDVHLPGDRWGPTAKGGWEGQYLFASQLGSPQGRVGAVYWPPRCGLRGRRSIPRRRRKIWSFSSARARRRRRPWR